MKNNIFCPTFINMFLIFYSQTSVQKSLEIQPTAVEVFESD